jgi:hypothetical protein
MGLPLVRCLAYQPTSAAPRKPKEPPNIVVERPAYPTRFFLVPGAFAGGSLLTTGVRPSKAHR